MPRVQNSTLPHSLMTSLILKPALLIKGLEESMIHLFLSVLESFLLAFEGGVPSTLKQGLSVVPKTPQVLSKPAHPPKLELLEIFWGKGGVGPQDLHFYQVSLTQPTDKSHLEEHCSKALGQRHKLHRRSTSLFILLSIISQSSAHTWVLIGTQLILAI